MSKQDTHRKLPEKRVLPRKAACVVLAVASTSLGHSSESHNLTVAFRHALATSSHPHHRSFALDFNIGWPSVYSFCRCKIRPLIYSDCTADDSAFVIARRVGATATASNCAPPASYQENCPEVYGAFTNTLTPKLSLFTFSVTRSRTISTSSRVVLKSSSVIDFCSPVPSQTSNLPKRPARMMYIS